MIEVINNIRDKPINTKVAVLKHIRRRMKASPTVRKRKLAPKKSNQKNARKDRKRAVAKFIWKVVIDAKTNNGSNIG